MPTRLRWWLRNVVARRRVERDLAEELAFHLHSRTRHWIGQGLPPDQAARRARLEFGTVEACKDECRQALGVRLIDELRADLTYGLRQMRAAPTFTAVVVSILALAIGANVAVFSVIDAVLLRMLPVERPRELRELAWIDRRDASLKIIYSGSMRPLPGNELLATSFAYPVYTHLRDQSTSFTDVFLFDRRALDLSVGGRRQRVTALLTSGNFLSGLGVRMAVGRAITPDDDRPDAPPVAVLSHGFWERTFGGNPSALGQTLVVSGTAAVVIGVTASTFDGVEPGTPVDVMFPIRTVLPAIGERRDALVNAAYWRFGVMARVKSGINEERVREETEALVRQAVPADSSGAGSNLPRVLVTPGGQGLDGLRRTYERPLVLLMAIMSVVLVIACANVAGLLLMRATSREREMFARVALGAGRARLIRQVLTESALLACLGGGVGLGFAAVTRGGLLPLLNEGRVPAISLALAPPVLAFSIGLCLAVGLLCGLVPALRTPRAGFSGARVVPGGGRRSSQFGAKGLIALQVALSLVLLVGAGLFTRTLLNLRSQAIGFHPDHILLFEMDPTASGYEKARLHDFYDRVLDRLAEIPGVRAVSLSRYALLSGGRSTDTIVHPGAVPGQEEVRVHLHFVSPRHLETMGIPLLAGRDLTARDRDGAPRVALANQALARLLAAAGAAVGRRILYARPDSDVEIVGVAADARFATLREPAPPTLYLPYRQYSQARMTFAARVAGEPLAIAAPVRRAIAEIDPNVPLLAVRTQEAQIDTAVSRERVFAYVASGFAVLALSLACLGIYGMLAYSVTRRTQEIGLRMALGAGRWQVVSLVIRQSFLPVAVGLAAGLGIVVATTPYVQTMLFELTPYDGPTIVLATCGLMLSALLAAWLPSRRASAVDPMTALRSE